MERDPLTKPPTPRSRGVIVVGLFAFVAGIGEVMVGFTGNFLGILSQSMTPSIFTGVVGAFYSLGGFFLLVTRKKWGAVLGMTFIGAEILGRVCLVATGIAPASGADGIKILIGALIAFGLIVYVFSKFSSFE